jgi:hypothetical protein
MKDNYQNSVDRRGNVPQQHPRMTQKTEQYPGQPRAVPEIPAASGRPAYDNARSGSASFSLEGMWLAPIGGTTMTWFGHGLAIEMAADGVDCVVWGCT